MNRLNFKPSCVKDVDQHEFVKAFALHLKKSGKLHIPEWSDYVKTGQHKELSPINPDWYYIRCAAVVRRLYIRKTLGIGGLTRAYGGRKRRGTCPGHFIRGSRSVARKVFQSLEGMNLVSKDGAGGRILTNIGRRDADRIAVQVAKDSRGPRSTRKAK